MASTSSEKHVDLGLETCEFVDMKRCATYDACKRVFDIAFSAAVTVLLAIPIGVTCIAIRLESAGGLPSMRRSALE